MPLKSGTWLVPSIENAEACKSIGGTMEKDVCILVDGPDGGWTAPIKGSYFAWGAMDMFKATGERLHRGRYLTNVMGCIVADSPAYPTFAGMCSPFYEGDAEEIKGKKDAIESARNEALGLAKDVLDGNARAWRLDYFMPNGRRAKFDEENAIVAKNNDLVMQIFKHKHQKVVEDFSKRRR
ncbi:MAG: hypothetical protein IMZ58_00645 [Thermoplasmata archaeon]|nr:hypothetical protein [Thermoplasmata archaeon]